MTAVTPDLPLSALDGGGVEQHTAEVLQPRLYRTVLGEDPGGGRGTWHGKSLEQ
jgi:hypothetical protein